MIVSARPRTLGRYLRGARRKALRLAARLESQARPVGHAYQMIDAHNHLGRNFERQGSFFAGRWVNRPVNELVAVLDTSQVEAVVDFDGGFGAQLEAELSRYQRPYPDRFVVFCGLDYESFGSEPNFGEVEARRLRASVKAGARGLKVWKWLGLHVRDSNGQLVAINDLRLGAIWDVAGELGVPVVIHVGDPPAFFEPLNARNPSRDELLDHPGWHHYPIRARGQRDDPRVPSHGELIEQFEEVLQRHPGTTFVAAHFAFLVADLDRLEGLIGRYSNLYVDTASRLEPLAADPRRFRLFLERQSDRVLFGTDSPPDLWWYRTQARFFGTRQRSLAYHHGEWPGVGQLIGRGLDLPPEVLRKVFRENARRVLLARNRT